MSADDELRAARAELDGVVEEIRSVPGYEQFLHPPTLDDVAAAAAGAPLLYVAAAEPGGVALIVRRRGIRPVELEALSARALRATAERFLDASGGIGKDARGFATVVRETSEWAWDTAMGPILEALGDTPEAVLVPAGLLGLLPLHAASTPDSATATGRRWALDRCLLTYAPNARALEAARRLAASAEGERLLVVNEPCPVDGPRLRSAEHETAAARAAFGSNVEVIAHEQADWRTVTQALNGPDVLHFACHGKADVAHPLDSALTLAHGEPLTLRQLMGMRLAARLAILSACETAVLGTELPDEVVALPTGLLQAGVAGVIASLWSVRDVSTMLLMVRFYETWGHLRSSAAAALREAQLWLRDTTNQEKHDHFAALLDKGEEAWLPRASLEACFEAVRFEDPSGRSWSEALHWAGFAYFGA